MQSFVNTYGPRALIAGASEGLGAAFAEALARRGLNLLLLARSEDKLRLLADKLEQSYGVQVQIEKMDLADIQQLENLRKKLPRDIGLLVYNAAYSPIGYFQDVSADDLLQITDVNIRAPLFLCRLLAPQLIQRKRGGILLMSSLAGDQGGPKIATYAASKAFNTMLAEGLWHEMRPYGVNVLASVAGAIRTPAYQGASQSKDAPGTLDPAEVAERSLNALRKGPVYTPGKINKVARFFLRRLLPRQRAISIMASNTKDLS